YDYMHARYYASVAGRFLSVDPGRDCDPKSPQSFNLYAYVRNNPVSATDPDGRLIGVAGVNQAYVSEMQKLLVSMIMRPTARRLLAAIQRDPRLFTFFGTNKLPPDRYGSTSGTEVAVAGGKAVLDLSKPFRVEVDTVRVKRGDPLYGIPPHTDKSGRTTLGHELWHATIYRTATDPNEAKRRNALADETGEAEEMGRRMANEKPDLSEELAKEILREWLEESTKALVAVTSSTNPISGKEESQ
ncbi:MAG: RHS repeat-associated core domain-containing protein, partial [Candidatus Hadarchaeum sp.]|uniref:RHS repeat-associated core domain-containing protein n=1 Tax=Candidatus Hadarchaeum sp. TaxID=2883567 RepID=UPI003D0BFD57